jgi:hypothetical protein
MGILTQGLVQPTPLPPTDEEDEIPPRTFREVKLAVLKLMNDKASGPDGLQAKLIKVD